MVLLGLVVCRWCSADGQYGAELAAAHGICWIFAPPGIAARWGDSLRLPRGLTQQLAKCRYGVRRQTMCGM